MISSYFKLLSTMCREGCLIPSVISSIAHKATSLPPTLVGVAAPSTPASVISNHSLYNENKECVLIIGLNIATHFLMPPIYDREALRSILHFFRALWRDSSLPSTLQVLMYQEYGLQFIISMFAGLAGTLPQVRDQ